MQSENLILDLLSAKKLISITSSLSEINNRLLDLAFVKSWIETNAWVFKVHFDNLKTHDLVLTDCTIFQQDVTHTRKMTKVFFNKIPYYYGWFISVHEDRI